MLVLKKIQQGAISTAFFKVQNLQGLYASSEIGHKRRDYSKSNLNFFNPKDAQEMSHRRHRQGTTLYETRLFCKAKSKGQD